MKRPKEIEARTEKEKQQSKVKTCFFVQRYRNKIQRTIMKYDKINKTTVKKKKAVAKIKKFPKAT